MVLKPGDVIRNKSVFARVKWIIREVLPNGYLRVFRKKDGRKKTIKRPESYRAVDFDK